MTQEVFNHEVKKIAKGWFWKWVLEKALPFIWANRSYIFELLKKEQSERPKSLMAGCNKHAITDPHYGELGDYDRNCVWHPWT